MNDRARWFLVAALAASLIAISWLYLLPSGFYRRHRDVPVPHDRDGILPTARKVDGDRTQGPSSPSSKGRPFDPARLETYPADSRAAAEEAKAREIAEFQNRYRQAIVSDPEYAEQMLQSLLKTHPYITRAEILTPALIAELTTARNDAEARADAFIQWMIGAAEPPAGPQGTPPSIADARLTMKQRALLIQAYPALARKAEPTQVFEVADLLARTGAPDALDFLRRQTMEVDQRAARAATRALCRLGDPTGVRSALDFYRRGGSLPERALLLNDLRTGASRLRRSTTDTRDASDGQAALDEAARFLAGELSKTTESEVRGAIVPLLHWDDPIQARALTDAFDAESDESVREEIVRRLATGTKPWPPAAVEFVMTRVVSSDPAVRLLLVPALAALGQTQPNARALLERMAETDPEPAVRTEAQAELHWDAEDQ